MKTIRNFLVASVAVFGLGIGSAQAVPLNIDTSGPLDLSVGEFDPFGAGLILDPGCRSELDCTFDALYGTGDPIVDWNLLDGSAGGFVTVLDLNVPSTLNLASAYFYLLLDDDSVLSIDLVAFGTDAVFSAFEFFGVLDAAGSSGPTYDKFAAFGADVGVVLTGEYDPNLGAMNYFANIVPIPTAVPEPGTLFLLGAGLAAFGIGRRRGKV